MILSLMAAAIAVALALFVLIVRTPACRPGSAAGQGKDQPPLRR